MSEKATKHSANFSEEVLGFFADHDIREHLFWTQDLKFFILCNDLFHWGCSDLEPLTEETMPELARACKDAGDDGPLLYCARRRGMRPQAPMYKHFNRENQSLFDAAGPERDRDEPW